MTAFTSYASIASASELVKSWDAVVADVKASRVASRSDAELAMDVSDNTFASNSPVLMSSVGTVTNTVDRTGVELNFFGDDWQFWGRGYILSDGTVVRFESSKPIRYVYISLKRTSLPPSGTYDFSMDFSSDVSFDIDDLVFDTQRTTDNAESDQTWYTLSSSQYDFMSGDLYVAPVTVSLNNQNTFSVVMRIKDNDLYNFSGSARFNFTRSSGDPTYSGIGSSVTDIEGDYKAGVTSSLGHIGDTLEEIVETISMQIEALWNQMYNFMHLPQMDKLEQIRQAIENIRLDVDVDNQDVVNKLDEQIQNDNANTQRVEQAVEKHGNFIIEGLKSLFIPDEEYFSSLFDRLHQFFSDRLGFLYVPFDLLIRLLDAIKDADTAFAGIPFPGIQAGEWVLLEPTTVTFDILNEFPELVAALHFITSVVMIGAFLNLLHRKMEEVMSR